jgi:hypothetical protein
LPFFTWLALSVHAFVFAVITAEAVTFDVVAFLATTITASFKQIDFFKLALFNQTILGSHGWLLGLARTKAFLDFLTDLNILALLGQRNLNILAFLSSKFLSFRLLFRLI